MTTLDLKPRSTLTINLRHRSDGDLTDFVHSKLHLYPHSVGPNEPWSPNVNRFDTLLPMLVPDELQHHQALVTSFVARTDVRQNVMGLHMKFTQTDSLPSHMHWEVIREFVSSKVVEAHSTPAIMVQHNPYERGFVDAAPPHVHVIVLARRRLLSDWGPTTPLVFNREWESLASMWAIRLADQTP
jgi:hypothetical protein